MQDEVSKRSLTVAEARHLEGLDIIDSMKQRIDQLTEQLRQSEQERGRLLAERNAVVKTEWRSISERPPLYAELIFRSVFPQVKGAPYALGVWDGVRFKVENAEIDESGGGWEWFPIHAIGR